MQDVGARDRGPSLAPGTYPTPLPNKALGFRVSGVSPPVSRQVSSAPLVALPEPRILPIVAIGREPRQLPARRSATASTVSRSGRPGNPTPQAAECPSSTDSSTGRRPAPPGRRSAMKGYIARKGNRWYAVIYEGTDPITGRERRSWHPAGCERADAERLAARLASERDGAGDGARSLSFGAFLTSRWLPGKRRVLAASTYNGYRRNVEGHVVPASAASACGACGRTTSRPSTTGCSTPATGGPRSHPRPCTR